VTTRARRRAAACFLAFFLAAGFSCASSGGAELGKPFTLKVGESASFEGGKLVMKFVSVPEDSRCPKGEQCVWAGNARVVLEVSKPAQAPQTVQLNTSRGPRDAELDGLVLKLESLDPEPSSSRRLRPEDYSVVLILGQ